MTKNTVAILSALCLVFCFGPQANGGGPTDIHGAAAAGDLSRIDVLLGQDPGLVKAQDGNGLTPLHAATRGFHVKVVERLLAAGADINAKDNKDTVALHMAILGSRGKVGTPELRMTLVTLLLKHGADVRIVDKRGHTPLHAASVAGRAPLAGLLLKAGADMSTGDTKGRTPLHYAAMHNQVAVIKVLLAKGANIEVRDKYGNTPLHLAMMNYRAGSVKQLLESGANPEAVNDRRETPLHIATAYGPNELEMDGLMTAVAELIFAEGVEANPIDKQGFTPLHYAKETKRGQLATLIRQQGGWE